LFERRKTFENRGAGRERITLGIATDGGISPDEALRESVATLLRQFRVFANYYPSDGYDDEDKGRKRSNVLIPPDIYERALEEVKLSFRAYNCLRRYGIRKVGQLLEMDEGDLLGIRNFGGKSLQELVECLQMGGYLPPGEEVYPGDGACSG